MPSIDQVNAQEASEEMSDVPVSDEDIEIVTRMGVQLLKQQNGLQVIKDAIDKSEDPAQVVGQMLATIIHGLAEQVSKNIDIDLRAFLAEGGFLERILDYIEDELGYPEEFSERIYQEVLEMLKAAAQDPPPPNDVMGIDQQTQMGPPPPPGIEQAGGVM